MKKPWRALREHFEVTDNQADTPWTKASWTQALSQHVGALTTGSDPVDAEVLKACPSLKAVANMAVGYNNFDVPTMTEYGVQASNTPDVLTETTADFGFALLMATARRITESEHYLRRGEWTQWRYDMFAGAEVHGSTIGILGMGRIGQGIARRAAHGFGMKVIYHNRSRLSAESEAECKATYVSKEELLKTADHVMLVVPYSAASHHTHWRGRISADEAHGYSHQHRTRRHCGRCCFGRGLARAPHCCSWFGCV